MYAGRTNRLRALSQCAIFSAVLCILSPLAIPLGPVPITLGSFAVLLTGTILPWRRAAAAVLVYLLMGIAGLPVFSGGGGGIGVLLGPTGGFLCAYIPMAAIVSRFAASQRRYSGILGGALSMVLCYLLGTFHFARVAGVSWAEGFSICVLSFIPIDILKISAALLLGSKIRRQLDSNGLLK